MQGREFILNNLTRGTRAPADDWCGTHALDRMGGAAPAGMVYGAPAPERLPPGQSGFPSAGEILASQSPQKTTVLYSLSGSAAQMEAASSAGVQVSETCTIRDLHDLSRCAQAITQHGHMRRL